jgi:large subunit ribosomal protein L22
MPYKYSTKQMEKSARAVSVNLPISTKHSVEISTHIRGMAVAKAQTFLEQVIAKKIPVRFRRFNRDVGHRRGMAAGRYPQKAASFILQTLKSAESNAADKGLLSESLFIFSIVPQKASKQAKYGRHRGRRALRTHIEIVLTEMEESGLPVEKTPKTDKPEQKSGTEAKEPEVEKPKAEKPEVEKPKADKPKAEKPAAKPKKTPKKATETK